MELISVIIPFYKKKKFIEKTIESVLNQTYNNLEILIIYKLYEQIITIRWKTNTIKKIKTLSVNDR